MQNQNPFGNGANYGNQNRDARFGQAQHGNPWQRRERVEESDSSTGQRIDQLNAVINRQNERRFENQNFNNGGRAQQEFRYEPQPQMERQPDPENRPAPVAMMSLIEQMQALKVDIAANPIKPEKLSMLPQQQQQVKILHDNLTEAKVDLESKTFQLAMFEALNTQLNLGFDAQLQQSKESHIKQYRKWEEEKLKLQKADLLASKYLAALEMPDIKEPPPFYRREVGLLDKKNIVRMITAYDDTNTNSTRSFKLVWSEILNFGRGEYLTEEEYKRILSVILHGNIAEDFRQMDKEERSLQEIINELCVLYDTTQTLDDYQHEVDNFKREKNESLKKAMARANKLVRRLEPLSRESAWPETYDNMRKSILRQIVASNTKAHIDMEESRLVKAGASYDVESLIRMAHEFEVYNNAVPTKEVQTVYQVASMAPRRSAVEVSSMEHQLNHLKSEKSLKQNWENKLDEVIQIATNAARYRERSKSFGDKTKKSGFKPPYKGNMGAVAKALNDGDTNMKDLVKMGQQVSNNRADKPETQQQERGRSTERRPYQKYDSNSRQSSYSTSKDRQSRPESYTRGQTPAPRSESEQRRYQENRYKKYEEKPSSNWRGPKLVVQGNKHCYECVPCNTMHSAEFICPKFYESEN